MSKRMSRRAAAVHTADSVDQRSVGSRATRRSPRCGIGRRVLAARRHRNPARPASEARTVVPLLQPPAGGCGSHRTHRIRAGALHLEDAVSRWQLAHRAGATGPEGRLAALVPPPRMHLTRYHGVFAPHSRLRAAVTPAGRGRGAKERRRTSYGWPTSSSAQRMRVSRASP